MVLIYGPAMQSPGHRSSLIFKYYDYLLRVRKNYEQRSRFQTLLTWTAYNVQIARNGATQGSFIVLVISYLLLLALMRRFVSGSSNKRSVNSEGLM